MLINKSKFKNIENLENENKSDDDYSDDLSESHSPKVKGGAQSILSLSKSPKAYPKRIAKKPYDFKMNSDEIKKDFKYSLYNVDND